MFVSFKRRDQFSHHCPFEMKRETCVPMIAVVQPTVTSYPSSLGTGDHGNLPPSVAGEKGGGHGPGTPDIPLGLYYVWKTYFQSGFGKQMEFRTKNSSDLCWNILQK